MTPASAVRHPAHPDDALIASYLERARDGDPADVLHAAIGDALAVCTTGPRWRDPVHGLGLLRERLLTDADRRRGSVHTPSAVARHLVEVTFDAHERGVRASTGAGPDWARLRVLDPAVGGGVFLLAAVDALVRRGVDPAVAVGCCTGVDTDPLAVEVAAAVLTLHGGGSEPDAGALVVGDALEGVAGGAFDVIVGNPPFQSQLLARSARTRQVADLLRRRFGDAARGYVDTALLFMLAGLDALATDGALCLVAPLSVLATADGRRARDRLLVDADLDGIWLAPQRVFPGADVRVCAPVLIRRPPRRARVRRWLGPAFARAERIDRPSPGDPSWSGLAADLFGAPPVDLGASDGARSDGARSDGEPSRADTVGSVATVTAGFRDEYYGLRGAVVEAVDPGDQRPRLVTSGAIDPAWCTWGHAPVRFAKQAWSAPVVDLDTLAGTDAGVARWGAALLVPKLLVATQTRVVEAVLDRDGTCWPSVPTVAVVAPPDQLDRLLAVVLAPPVSAWCLAHAAGGALAHDALRVSARLLASVPLPTVPDAWDEATAVLHDDVAAAAEAQDRSAWSAALARYGLLMCAAYRADGSVAAWWHARLPRGRSDEPVAGRR